MWIELWTLLGLLWRPVWTAAAAVAAVAFGIVNVGGNALRDAGSGTAFTPVNGLATAFPYNTSRNPMCAPLAASACPAV